MTELFIHTTLWAVFIFTLAYLHAYFTKTEYISYSIILFFQLLALYHLYILELPPEHGYGSGDSKTRAFRGLEVLIIEVLFTIALIVTCIVKNIIRYVKKKKA